MDVTVHLIDRDPGAFEALRELLESTGCRLDPHHSPDSFLGRHDPGRPGCILMNLGTRALDGAEFLKELNTHEVPMPVVFATFRADTSELVRLMHSGAVSLLEKPYRQGLLLAAIHSAVRLHQERLKVSARRRELHERICRLSEGERIVLHALLAGETNKRIASRLGLGLRTIEYRRHSIFSKLNVHSIAEMAVTVAELQRLTDICTLLNAPPMHWTDAHLASSGSLDQAVAAIDRPHAAPRKPVQRMTPMRNEIPG